MERTLSMVSTVPTIAPTQTHCQETNPYRVSITQLIDILTTPSSYEEAFFNEYQWCQQRRKEAINLESNKMKSLKVWHTVNRTEILQTELLSKTSGYLTLKRLGFSEPTWSLAADF
jgi:hypothetical protein